jgi:hypothetical protein
MAADETKDQARYNIIMVSSLFIFITYTILLTVTLIMIKSKVQFAAIIIMGSFLFAFTIKAVCDTVRALYGDSDWSETLLKVTGIIAWVADRINVVTIIYLAFVVNEVKLKLEAATMKEFKQYL